MRTDAAMKRARLQELYRRSERQDDQRIRPVYTKIEMPKRKPRTARQVAGYRARLKKDKQFKESLLVVGLVVLWCVWAGLAG